jgi:hypothetical protein
MAGHTDDASRQLIHIPLIHAPADMGTMAQGLEAVFVGRLGRRRWQEQVALAERFWGAVRGELESLHLDYTRVDLYQDGLPVCGKEAEIVRAAAGQGSENHQLLVDLMTRGASLVGTEDVRLLLEEYEDLQAAVGRALPAEHASRGVVRGGKEPPASQRRGFEDGGQALPPRYLGRLAERDAYIGRRIGATLLPGRTGILLLGMAHAIEPHLPGDIVVSRLNCLAV